MRLHRDASGLEHPPRLTLLLAKGRISLHRLPLQAMVAGRHLSPTLALKHVNYTSAVVRQLFRASKCVETPARGAAGGEACAERALFRMRPNVFLESCGLGGRNRHASVNEVGVPHKPRRGGCGKEVRDRGAEAEVFHEHALRKLDPEGIRKARQEFWRLKRNGFGRMKAIHM